MRNHEIEIVSDLQIGEQLLLSAVGRVVMNKDDQRVLDLAPFLKCMSYQRSPIVTPSSEAHLRPTQDGTIIACLLKGPVLIRDVTIVSRMWGSDHRSESNASSGG